MTQALEWADLWAAMEKEPNRWFPTTEHMFVEMRDCVPPEDMGYGGFIVGEAHHHENGEAVYACFVSRHGYQARYMTAREFKQWKDIRK